MNEIISLISFSVCLLLAWRKVVDFCVLISSPTPLLKVLIAVGVFFRVFYVYNMHKDALTFSLIFSCLTADCELVGYCLYYVEACPLWSQIL